MNNLKNMSTAGQAMLLIAIFFIFNAALIAGFEILTLLGAPSDFVTGWAIVAVNVFCAFLFYTGAKMIG